MNFLLSSNGTHHTEAENFGVRGSGLRFHWVSDLCILDMIVCSRMGDFLYDR